MPAPNFLMDPRYQRAIRKRYNVDPRDRAIPMTDDIVSKFGAEQAGREVYGLGRGAELENRASRIDLAKQRQDLAERRFETEIDLFNKGMGLKRDQISSQDTLGKLGLGIGAANVGLSGLGAYQDIKQAELESSRYQEIADSLLELIDLEVANRKRMG